MRNLSKDEMDLLLSIHKKKSFLPRWAQGIILDKGFCMSTTLKTIIAVDCGSSEKAFAPLEAVRLASKLSNRTFSIKEGKVEIFDLDKVEMSICFESEVFESKNREKIHEIVKIPSAYDNFDAYDAYQAIGLLRTKGITVPNEVVIAIQKIVNKTDNLVSVYFSERTMPVYMKTGNITVVMMPIDIPLLVIE